VSHDANKIRSTPVTTSSNILLLANDVDVIGIDEAQFFDDELLSVCNELANRGIRVIVAGLDMDFKGQPFGPMPALMATAEYVTKVHAICMRCGNLANYSHRIIKDDQLVVLGETDAYEPLCRKCFTEARGESK
jgi:thymidine kinase